MMALIFYYNLIYIIYCYKILIIMFFLNFLYILLFYNKQDNDCLLKIIYNSYYLLFILYFVYYVYYINLKLIYLDIFYINIVLIM